MPTTTLLVPEMLPTLQLPESNYSSRLAVPCCTQAAPPSDLSAHRHSPFRILSWLTFVSSVTLPARALCKHTSEYVSHSQAGSQLMVARSIHGHPFKPPSTTTIQAAAEQTLTARRSSMFSCQTSFKKGFVSADLGANASIKAIACNT